MRTLGRLFLASLLVSCSSDPEVSEPGDLPETGAEVGVDSSVTDAASDAEDASVGDVSDTSDVSTLDVKSDTTGETPSLPCVLATGTGAAATNKLVDGSDEATVGVSAALCRRSYFLSTTAPRRESLPASPRTITEAAEHPFVRTRNDLFDALYALALNEAKENSVAAIKDGGFENGAAIACPTGGCFETGRLWTYVWTRDTAYSVHLGLGALDPIRARNSLEFKLSDRRGGGDTQIVQDTGSGGSYPVSTDRVVWSLGAMELLTWLSGAERAAFRDKAYDAMKNTVEHDRKVVFDPQDGLYRGEQSFLDWREQSYPRWTESDTVHLGMSKSLSTNVAHLAILDGVIAIASEKADAATVAKYQPWADALRTAIRGKLWLASEKQFSTFITTTLDPAPVRRFDALGTSLAVLHGVGTDSERKEAIASYPVLARGVPGIWPQQKETAIYHNRAMWPFVTAYYARAARKVRNDAAVDLATWSLMRGAALNLSNMENLEIVSGRAYVEDGAYSGPVVNSQRQLWSVAGYLALVQGVIFGVDTTPSSIAFAPYVTRKMRHELFGNADSIALNDFVWRGKKLTVVVKLPAKTSVGPGAYTVAETRVNGAVVTAPLDATALASDNRVEITLSDTADAGGTVKLVTATSDYKNVFGPKNPNITGINGGGANLVVTWNANGELPGEVTFDVYRDGVRVATDLPGTTTSFTDTTATAASPSHCYAVEATFASSKNHGQHSPPSCWWGTSSARIKTFLAGTGPTSFTATGGTLVNNHGYQHYENWGDAGHELVADLTVPTTGDYLLQVTAGNGAGAINTGVTAGLKLVEVWDGTTRVASGYLLMPHLGAWSTWKGSSFVRATLATGKTYKVVIKHDVTSVNMSFFAHFDRYTGGTGGKTGAFSRVNIAELKVLGL